MRKANQEIRDPKALETILANGVICRLAMIDNGRPYLLPFNYGYRGGMLYIHSAPEGKKLEILRRDNEVCFEIEEAARIIESDKACGWSTLYRSVVGYATVEIITDKAGKEEGLKVIMAQHGAPGLTEFDPRSLSRMVVLKLTIQSMTGKQSSNWDQHGGGQ